MFWLFDYPIRLADAIILEAVGQIVKTAGFGLPGGLGVQEGGVVLAASWLAIPAELALAAMLIRRIRDLACSLIGLLVWTRLEVGKSQEARLLRGVDPVR